LVLEEIGRKLAHEAQAQLRSPHALPPQGNGRGPDVGPHGIDPRSVPNAELHLGRGGRSDDVRDLVEPDEATLVVGHLDVDVEGNPGRRAQLAQLRG
jgi:hypothetical protein